MPQFPVYESQQQVEVPKQIAVPEKGKDVELSATNNLIGTLQKVTDKWAQAESTMQYTKATFEAEQAILAQEQAAANDPDPNNVEKHLKALQDIQTQSTKDISNSNVSDAARMKIEHASFLAGIKIDNMFKKKKMFANDQLLDQYATVASEQKSNAITDAAGQQVEGDFINTVQANVARGLITPSRADQLVRSYKVGVVKNDSIKDPATEEDNSQVLKNLNAGKYDLDIQERSQAEKMIKAKIQQNKVADIKNNMQYRSDIIKSIANGDETWKNPDTINKVALKDPKLAEAMQAVLSADSKGTSYATDKEQDQNFADIVNKIFSSKTKEEIGDHFIDALKSNANRNMSKDRLAIIVNAAEQKNQTIPTVKESDDSKPNPIVQGMQNAIKSIQDFFKGSKDEKSNIGQTTQDMLRNVSSGQTPELAQKEAMKSFNVKQYPWISSLPKEGQIRVDKNGNKVKVYPDGHYEEVK